MTKKEFLQSQISYLCTVIDEEKLEYISMMAMSAAKNSKASSLACFESSDVELLAKGRHLYFHANREQKEHFHKEMTKIVSIKPWQSTKRKIAAGS